MYTINDIDKIIEFKSWNDKKKIDELLRIDCDLYTNLGIESTKSDRAEAKKNSRKIYRQIKLIDYKIGNDFLVAMDRD
ncbi:unnamed protein product [marine sediment metagenome]|uniref:Uncharacterized protein n=1 Tax=marine sediment metagenome TaxID=412755 RepID=X0T4C6_9ZZZZ